MTTDTGDPVQRKTATAVMTTIRGMDLVVERTQKLLLARPGEWFDEHFEVMLLGVRGIIDHYAYPDLGVRRSHFRYKVENFLALIPYHASDLAWSAAYERFTLMRTQIEKGGKPV